MINRIKKNSRVIRVLIGLRFQNLMMIRLGFFGPFFVDGSLFLIQLVVFQTIYTEVDRIGTWESGEMILYIGTFSMLNAINMLIYFFGVIGIPDKIKSGEMDLYLTKPISPLLRLSFEKINLGSFPLVIMSAFIIVYGISLGNIQLTVEKIVVYIFWMLIMSILYYDLIVIIRSISFFVISNSNITRVEEAGLELCMQLPGIVFYGVYKFIFYCVLPYGILATIPVQSLLGELKVINAIYGIMVVAVFTVITCVIWKRGIRHYNSASS
ncbi:MAG: transporter permease [Clostridiales bacterium]|jgi:ABC-2 type transport system permease protein|nr:transporter permease [Clostridiales bacterium]